MPGLAYSCVGLIHPALHPRRDGRGRPGGPVSVLVASDLDRTLIYSRKARRLGPDDVASVCAEIHDGKQASFMTARAAGELALLARTEVFVPVTTRILAQYRRVMLPGPPPR